MSKKYLLISEVAEVLGLSQSALRYLEKSENKVKISRIRGRRYYKISDISKIAELLGIDYRNKNLLQKTTEKQVEVVQSVRKDIEKTTKSFPMKEKIIQLDMFEKLDNVVPKQKIEQFPIVEQPRINIDIAMMKMRMENCRKRLAQLLEGNN